MNFSMRKVTIGTDVYYHADDIRRFIAEHGVDTCRDESSPYAQGYIEAHVRLLNEFKKRSEKNVKDRQECSNTDS